MQTWQDSSPELKSRLPWQKNLNPLVAQEQSSVKKCCGEHLMNFAYMHWSWYQNPPLWISGRVWKLISGAKWKMYFCSVADLRPFPRLKKLKVTNMGLMTAPVSQSLAALEVINKRQTFSCVPSIFANAMQGLLALRELCLDLPCKSAKVC